MLTTKLQVVMSSLAVGYFLNALPDTPSVYEISSSPLGSRAVSGADMSRITPF